MRIRRRSVSAAEVRARLLRVLLGAALFGPPVHGAAALQCDSVTTLESVRLARRYAPILNFAPGEGYFPTLPFFRAFDEVSEARGADPRYTNLDRVAALAPGKDSVPSWVALDTMYRVRAPELRAPTSSAVLYRVRALNRHEVGTLWTFLKNDPQAWSRLGAQEYYVKGLSKACFLVVEYYFYYVRDAGLQGHPNDMERVSVFLPRLDRLVERLPGRVQREKYVAQTDSLSETSGEALARELVSGFALIVGSGHSTTTPNNVLVVTGETARNLSPPAVLVERGGHSSAPNMRPYTEFNLGLDINWNLRENVWGTRDLQAISGRGFLGDYDGWMTLPRDPESSVTLAFDTSEARVRTIQEQQVAQYRPEKADSAIARPTQRLTSQYALIEVEALHRLFETADSFKRFPTRRDSLRRHVVTLVGDTIGRKLRVPLRAFDGLSDAETDAAILRMASWNRPMVDGAGKAPHSDHRTWVAGFYTAGPTRILKRSLYRPSGNAVRNAGDIISLVSPTVGWVPGRTAFAQTNILLPAFGRVLSVPGILELQVGAPFRSRTDGVGRNVMLGLLFDRHYKSAISWYARLGYLKDRATIQRVPEARDFDFGAGLSLMPFFPFVDNLPPFLGVLAQKVRVRLGAQIDVRDWDPKATVLQWEFVLYQR